MEQTGELQKIRMIRLQALIAPIHKKKLEDEIKAKMSKGRKTTKSEIIRQSLDARYFSKRGKNAV
jgi:hypothetical protein